VQKYAKKNGYCQETDKNGNCRYPHCGCLYTENGSIDPETGEVLLFVKKAR